MRTLWHLLGHVHPASDIANRMQSSLDQFHYQQQRPCCIYPHFLYSLWSSLRSRALHAVHCWTSCNKTVVGCNALTSITHINSLKYRIFKYIAIITIFIEHCDGIYQLMSHLNTITGTKSQNKIIDIQFFFKCPDVDFDKMVIIIRQLYF